MLPDGRPAELDGLVDNDDDEDGAEEDDDGQGEGAAVQDALLGPGLRLVVAVLVVQPPLAQGPHGARVLHQARGQEDAALHRLVRNQNRSVSYLLPHREHNLDKINVWTTSKYSIAAAHSLNVLSIL